jgi:WD40 repeat protein
MLAKFSKAAVCLICLSLLLPAQFNYAFAQSKAKSSTRKAPGKTAAGTLLPNGWTLTPEGAQVPTSDLPLNMVLSNDGRYLLVTTNGNGDQTINVIDLQRGESAQTLSVKKSWLGLAFAPDGKRFFVSGGDDNEVMVFDFANGKAEQ